MKEIRWNDDQPASQRINVILLEDATSNFQLQLEKTKQQQRKKNKKKTKQNKKLVCSLVNESQLASR